MKNPVARDPEGIERQNALWWEIHQEDKPFRARGPLDQFEWPLKVQDAEGKVRAQQVGNFCHCPLPVSGVRMWGFEREADLIAFAAKYPVEIL